MALRIDRRSVRMVGQPYSSSKNRSRLLHARITALKTASARSGWWVLVFVMVTSRSSTSRPAARHNVLAKS